MAFKKTSLKIIMGRWGRGNLEYFPAVTDWAGIDVPLLNFVRNDAALINMHAQEELVADTVTDLNMTGATAATCVIRATKSTTGKILASQTAFNQGDYVAGEDLSAGKVTWLLSIGMISYAITAVNTGTKTFSIAGDYTFQFADDDTLKITGSTGNNGTYTINGAPTYNSGTGYTEIIVDETVADATVDGNIEHSAIDNDASLFDASERYVSGFLQCTWSDADSNPQSIIPPFPARVHDSIDFLAAAVSSVTVTYATEAYVDAEIAAIPSPTPSTYLELARQYETGVKRLAYTIYPSGKSAVLSGTGYVSSLYEYDSGTGPTNALDDGGYYSEFITGTSTSDKSYMGVNNYYYSMEKDSDFFMRFRFGISHLTDVRFFLGVVKYGVYPNITLYDDYNADHCGITFSTARPDTNLQFVSRKVSVGETLVDSGVAPNVSEIYDMEMEYSGGGTSLRFRITDWEGNILCADTNVTTNLPTTTQLDPCFSIFTLADAAKGFRFYRAEVWI